MAQGRRTSGRMTLGKAPSGIEGLDDITGGGLPRGRPTLVCGTAGRGKTLLGLEFLVRGATEHGEPGVLMAFEETAEDLAKNAASLGFELEKQVAQKKLGIDCVLLLDHRVVDQLSTRCRARQFERRRTVVEAQIAALRAEVEGESLDFDQEVQRATAKTAQRDRQRSELQAHRQSPLHNGRRNTVVGVRR